MIYFIKPTHPFCFSTLIFMAFISAQIAPKHAAAQSVDNLGTLGGNIIYAYALSAAGSIVAGQSENTFGQNQAFRWTQEDGMVGFVNTLGGNSS